MSSEIMTKAAMPNCSCRDDERISVRSSPMSARSMLVVSSFCNKQQQQQQTSSSKGTPADLGIVSVNVFRWNQEEQNRTRKKRVGQHLTF